jgi:hypothetical protein
MLSKEKNESMGILFKEIMQPVLMMIVKMVR